MNLESTPVKKGQTIVEKDDFDFDFKPITSGLGFNQKVVEIKPAFTERTVPQVSSPQRSQVQKESSFYQNDLSIFYGSTQTQNSNAPQIEVEEKTEKFYRLSTKSQRVFAYSLDLALVLSALGVVLTIMARTIGMDLMTVWESYPSEVNPLAVTLFVGFYMMYFSIFEKTYQSTLGKNLLNLRVVNQENKLNSLSVLLLRSFITLVNFISLGLFSYFDLQNKVTQSKVIRID